MVQHIVESINVIQHINRSKNKNHMIFSIYAKKAFDKFLHHFMIKAQRKLEIEGMYLNLIKAIYNKPNREKLKPFPLNSGTRQECPLSPLLFNIAQVFLVRAVRKKKK
jgi:hypothetical protein